MKHIRKILVPTDLSGHSLAAVEYAASLSLLYRARLYLLYVDDDVPPPMYTLYVPDRNGESYRARTLANAMDTLRGFIARHIKPELNLIPVARLGKPADQINAFAADEGIDLIVMATHGRTGIEHVLMGSVAERVVRTARVPVLTVKPPLQTPQERMEETADTFEGENNG